MGRCQEGRQLGRLFNALASPVCGHSYSGICLAKPSTPTFLLLLAGNSVEPYGLNLVHRLPRDKTVFVIDVAQIIWKNLWGGVVLSTVALNKGDVPGGRLAFEHRKSCKKE